VRIIEDKFILNREFICETSISSGQRRLLGRIDRIRGDEYCEMGYYSARKFHKLHKLECSFITGYQFPKRTCEILKSGSCIISANRSIFRTLAQEVVSMSQRLLIYHILRSLYCSFLIPFTWPITFPPRLTPNTISINSIKNCTYIMQTLNKKSRTVSTGLFPLLNVLSTNLNGS
jgi:hypothetical protein